MPHIRWIDIKSATELSVNDFKQLVKDRKKWHISEQHSQQEKTDPCLTQGEEKPLLRECCLVHLQGSPGVLQTWRTKSSSASSKGLWNFCSRPQETTSPLSFTVHQLQQMVKYGSPKQMNLKCSFLLPGLVVRRRNHFPTCIPLKIPVSFSFNIWTFLRN